MHSRDRGSASGSANFKPTIPSGLMRSLEDLVLP
jgi:hypothetical protein